MKTDSIEVGKVLQDEKRFTVPIYQRQYAWRADRLQPFWDDLVAKAEEILDGPPKFQHYMGALILAPGADGYSVGRVSSVLVVDGQQRLTSFQLFIAALRYIAEELGEEKFRDALDVYVFTDARYSSPNDTLSARLKLIPTPADRAIFRDLMTAEWQEVKARHPGSFYKNGNVISGQAPRALLAFLFFYERISRYAKFGFEPEDEVLTEARLEEADKDTKAKRLQALADALLINFKLVVITLEEGDDAQVIFETLNSRGEPLLAMDLVRNNIFHRAEAQGEDAQALFETRWKPYDDRFWKEDAPRAKPRRPRIDHFLSHVLTAQTGRETSLRELYAEYRSFARPKGKSRFEKVSQELDALLKFNPVYEALERYTGDADVSWLGRKLSVWEVATAYPLVFAVATSDIDEAEKLQSYRLIYSYIVRRALCGLTNKSLNKNFVRILAQMREKGVSLQTIAASFATQTGPAVRFPNNDELAEAIATVPIYEQILRAERLLDILWELERASRTKFQVDEGRPSGLSIEHILPQSWYEHWPLRDGSKATYDRSMMTEAAAEAARVRNSYRHRLGNLTLVTEPLNSSMQNQGFDKKRDRLGKSLLALNGEIGSQVTWDEDAINRRASSLAALAVKIWPAPR